MGGQHRMNQAMTSSDVRQRFASVINRVARQELRVIVQKSGIPVAGIVSAEDLNRLDRLDQLDREREEDFAIIDELREAFRGVPDEEIERETDRILGTATMDESVTVR